MLGKSIDECCFAGAGGADDVDVLGRHFVVLCSLARICSVVVGSRKCLLIFSISKTCSSGVSAKLVRWQVKDPELVIVNNA